MKIGVQKLSHISETLLLPLYFRAAETRRPDALLKDDLAADMIRRIDYDFSCLEGKLLTQTATMLRIREFDRLTRCFMENHPDSTVVNLGCGLDTRFFRVDNGSVQWYELDLPEVMVLRREFFQETERYRFIECSMFDPSWMDAIQQTAQHRILLLCEGVLMYLPANQVRNLFQNLLQRFRDSLLIFDAVSPLQVWLSYFHPVISITKACFQWGLLFGKTLETWTPGIRVISEHFYLNQAVPRFGCLNTLQLFPHIVGGFRILRCRLNGQS